MSNKTEKQMNMWQRRCSKLERERENAEKALHRARARLTKAEENVTECQNSRETLKQVLYGYRETRLNSQFFRNSHKVIDFFKEMAKKHQFLHEVSIEHYKDVSLITLISTQWKFFASLFSGMDGVVAELGNQIDLPSSKAFTVLSHLLAFVEPVPLALFVENLEKVVALCEASK